MSLLCEVDPSLVPISLYNIYWVRRYNKMQSLIKWYHWCLRWIKMVDCFYNSMYCMFNYCWWFRWLYPNLQKRRYIRNFTETNWEVEVLYATQDKEIMLPSEKFWTNSIQYSSSWKESYSILSGGYTGKSGCCVIEGRWIGWISV